MIWEGDLLELSLKDEKFKEFLSLSYGLKEIEMVEWVDSLDQTSLFSVEERFLEWLLES